MKHPLPWQSNIIRADRMEGGTILNVHNQRACEGNRCTMHNLHQHHMRIFPQFFDSDVQAMFRVCPHREFHVDPDERDHIRRREEHKPGQCCGCCV